MEEEVATEATPEATPEATLVDRTVRRGQELTLRAARRGIAGLGSAALLVSTATRPLRWAARGVEAALWRRELERGARDAGALGAVGGVDLARAAISEGPHVVVLGGGFAGVKVKLELESRGRLDGVSVTIVDSKDFFEYSPGILRVLVRGGLEEVTRAFPRDDPSWVRGRAARVEDDAVVLEDGRVLPFDFLVVATGASYSGGGAIAGSGSDDAAAVIKSGSCAKRHDNVSLEDRRAELDATRERIRRAQSILVVGGGLVGVELAGELADEFGAHKEVTLLHRGAELCPTLPPRARAYVADRLAAAGVRVELEAEVAELSETRCAFDDAGGKRRELRFDLCFKCTGTRPNTDWLRGGPLDAALAESGHLEVNAALQVAADARGCVFALGDAARHAPSQRYGGNGLYADLQAEVVVHNVLSKVRGAPAEALKQFPWCFTGSKYLVPMSSVTTLGAVDGTFQFEHIVVNGFMSALLKIVLEETKLQHMAGNPLGKAVWWLSDKLVVLAYREVFLARRRVLRTMSA